MENDIVPENQGTTFTLENVSREMNKKIVKCEVNNLIGKSEGTERLVVHCKLLTLASFALADYVEFSVAESAQNFVLISAWPI